MFKCNYDLKTLTKEKIIEICDTPNAEEIVAEYENEDMLVLLEVYGDFTDTWLIFKVLQRQKDYTIKGAKRYTTAADYFYNDIMPIDITYLPVGVLKLFMKHISENYNTFCN